MSLNDVSNLGTPPQWKADFMHPMEGLVRNALHTRLQPWTVVIAGVPCQLRVPLYGVATPHEQGHSAGLKPLADVALYLVVHLGAERWLVELGQGFPLTLHPAMADVSDESLLPQALCHAVMELLITPLAEAFGAFMDMRVTCEIVGAQPDGAAPDSTVNGGEGTSLAAIQDMMKQAHCALPLLLSVPQTSSSQASTVPCIVHITGQASANILYQKVSALPPQIHDIAGLFVPVSIEAGSMTLSAEELAGLQADDILLPDSYPARDGRVTLRMSQCVMPCVLDQGKATVEAIVPLASPMSQESDQKVDPKVGNVAQGENPVSPEQNQTAPAAQAGVDSVHVAGLDVTVSFELERRSMTLGELSMISPGYTLVLGVDALAPVTLRVGDKVLGTGRLVDLGGTMGVQVTHLADNATVKKPIETTAVGVMDSQDAESTEKKPVRGLASFTQVQAEDAESMISPRAGDYA